MDLQSGNEVMRTQNALLATDLLELDLFRRGKVRDIYDLGSTLLFVATDRISAFDVVMKQGIPGKGVMLTKLSVFWFEFLKNVVPNHLISADFGSFPPGLRKYPEIAGRSMIVRKLKRIDIECVVRGYISGSGWNEYQTVKAENGMKNLYGNWIPVDLVQSQKFPEPIFTPAIKSDNGHDENISLGRFYDLIGVDLGNLIIQNSIELYERASEYAYSRGLIIADTKFEFGLNDGKLILIDEVLTPDSSRFWNLGKYKPGWGQESFDKQYLRDYLKRIGWNGNPPPPDLPDEVILSTAAKYHEALTILTTR